MTSFLSLGRLHLPVYGLAAAIGLMAAMALGQRSARLARLEPNAMWDTGMFAVLAAFFLSRVLLVLENVPMFVSAPALVLELPSISTGGLAVAALLTARYARRRGMPLLRLLDAAAPCALLLMASLSAGSMAGGTREGMPTRMPWAVSSSFGRVHPLELYSAAGLLALAGWALWRVPRTQLPGETAAWALALYGMLRCLLDFFRLPQELYGASLLDGEQWRGLEIFGVGAVLLLTRLAWPVRETTRRETESFREDGRSAI